VRLAALLVLAGAAASGDANDEARSIEVVAKRYAFSPEQIEVSQGESIRLVLRSADVTHSLKIEAYDIDVEIPKGGEAVEVRFVADRAGTFRIECSKYCGSGHRKMRGEFLVRATDGGAR
jgi:cytochrome c oxidase subunit 2